MELELIRTCYPTGTNGQLYHGGKLICYTIELPWKDNHTGVSCIPVGKYELVKRYSLKLHWHLELMDVPGRQFILIHPANNALVELKGCIAPVSILTGPGRGLQSRDAFNILNALVFAALAAGDPIFLTIKK
jgi:hypothetical protein